MQAYYLLLGYFILVINGGLDAGSEISDNAYSTASESASPMNSERNSIPLCRIIRNARNAILETAHAVNSDPNFIKNCVISNSCTTLFCSTNAKEENESFGWDLNLCDPKTGPTINFLLNSLSMPSANWSYLASPAAKPQRTKVPLQQNGMEYYLDISFLRWSSQLHGPDDKWSTLSLDVSIETCNGTCDSMKLFRDIKFPLRQLCPYEYPDFAPGSLLKNVPEQVQIPSSITSHIGMPCSLQNPFACGTNSVCRKHEGGREDEGICDCCDFCVLLGNGTCSSLPNTTTTTSTGAPPSASHESGSSAVATGVGSFLAIVSLFVLGGGIFYAVKYNTFPRVRNRLNLYWTSWCNRRVNRVAVTDQGSMFNPLYDDAEPALL